MIELDNTARVCFDSCEQKYYLRHVLDLVPKEPPSMAPFYGISIHSGIRAFYEGKSREEVQRAFADEYVKYYDGRDEDRTVGNAVIILDEYAKRWKEDYLETEQTEIGGGVVIQEGEVEVFYKGRIDRRARWGPSGERAIEDWKTSKYVGSQFTLLRPNSQFVGYALMERELTGVNPEFFLTMIGTQVRKRGAKNRALEEGEERVAITRESTKYQEWEFEEFRRGVISTARRIRECEREEYWPKRTHSCPSFQGCEYIPLCKRGKAEFELLVEAFYKREKWEAWTPI